ncbi:MAG TPA: hypothetical protein VFR59_08980 [Steroidobacteraceae bacterium]|nr:hypothetical protein [Steroidobacteraceae bacterium]
MRAVRTMEGEFIAREPTPAEAVAAEHAEAGGLIYVSDMEPGIRRRRRGDRFVYVDPQGEELRDLDEIARISSLAIPPAYTDVWICVHERGHLQATGRDARHRKQYRYHPEWRLLRDSVKFDRMVEFAEALPRLRRRLSADLARRGLPREKVLALIVSLLDVTRVRIGNAEYARDNNSFGLSTLRNRHVKFSRDGRALLSFRGKGGTAHEVQVDDRRLARIVRHCQELPGQQLFQFLDDDGTTVRAVDSGQVNDYLREALGGEFTAKDFRTWGATLRAMAIMAATPLPEPMSESACKSCIVAAIRHVAADLRNTPAVCRKSYINPVVFQAWRAGRLPKAAAHVMNDGAPPRRVENLVISFLKREARRAARMRKS